MIEFTRENIDKQLNTLWKMTIAIGLGDLLNDPYCAFFILEKDWREYDKKRPHIYWVDPFVKRRDVWSVYSNQPDYFHTEKAAITHYLDWQSLQGRDIHVYQLQGPVELLELVEIWKQTRERIYNRETS